MLKQFLKKIIPVKLQPVVKLLIRRIWYFGLKYECPVCRSHVRLMKPLGLNIPVLTEKNVIGAGKRNAMCPVCDSSDRVRLLYLFLTNKTDIFLKKIKLLHIAPEKQLKEIFEKQVNIEYLTADLNPENVMIKMDILDIQYPDNNFDMIICNHVLEHIPDDRKAMKELLRVLKPGGSAILQVPISLTLEKTFEDATIVSPEEREKVFGQNDHVRIYGKDYSLRLKETGFNVKEYQWTKDINILNPGNMYCLNKNEIVYFCIKS